MRSGGLFSGGMVVRFSQHVRLTAVAIGVSERTGVAVSDQRSCAGRAAGAGQVEIDDRLRPRLAYHRGNAAIANGRDIGGSAVDARKLLKVDPCDLLYSDRRVLRFRWRAPHGSGDARRASPDRALWH
jgi:hypothetical protein